MSRYEIGESYFLKARVAEIADDGMHLLKVVVPVNTPLKSEYTNIYMANVPGILLTAEEICTGEDSCKRLKEIDAVNHEQAEKILSLQRAVEKLREENDELQKTCEENVNVALDLARQRDGLKEEFEAALKNLADTGKTCDVFKKQRDEVLKDKDDLQKAVEALNKDIDEYRATIQKMASVIGFICGTKGGQDG